MNPQYDLEKIKFATDAPTWERAIRLYETGKVTEFRDTGYTFTAIRYIKSYDGPSRIWFAYQNSLMEGCNRLSAIVSDLPVSEQTARLLVSLLLRLDKKLMTGGVDDSDGTVGTFIEETVEVLKQFVALDPACTKTFDKLKGQETCFGWEESLLAMTH